MPGSYAWGRPVEVLDLALDPVFVRWVAQRDLGFDEPELRPHGSTSDAQVAALAHAIRCEVAAGNPGGAVTMDGYALLLSVQVLTRFSARPVPLPGRANGLPAAAVARVREYVEVHLAEDLRLQELADVAHLSPYHFARCFRAATGRSPHQYVIDRRVEAARRALAARAVPIAALARAVGFAGAGHLSRHFRPRVGTTPAAYARTQPESTLIAHVARRAAGMSAPCPRRSQSSRSASSSTIWRPRCTPTSGSSAGNRGGSTSSPRRCITTARSEARRLRTACGPPSPTRAGSTSRSSSRARSRARTASSSTGGRVGASAELAHFDASAQLKVTLEVMRGEASATSTWPPPAGPEVSGAAS